MGLITVFFFFVILYNVEAVANIPRKTEPQGKGFQKVLRGSAAHCLGW